MALVAKTHTRTCRCLCQLIITRRKATMATEFLNVDGGMVPSIAQFLLGTHSRHNDSPAMPEETAVAVKPFSAIPGPRGLPFAGNALKYSKLGPYKFSKILHNRMTYMRKYGKIYTERLGTMDIVHIFDPRDIAAMFRNEGKHPSRGTIANLELTYLRRNNLLVGFAFIDGPEWTRQRGVIQRLMMHPLAAARFLPMQVPVAQDFVTYIRGKMNVDGIVPGLYSDLFKFTMEAIGVVCFNERLGALTETGDPTRDAGELSSAIQETFFCFRNCMFNFPWYKYFRTPMYRRFEKAANKMRFIMGVHVNRLRERAAEHALEKAANPEASVCPYAGHQPEDKSIYETLMKDDRVSNDLCANIIMALFRTGIDSTGNAMAFFLYNLANNPDKQQLLYEEIQNNLPGKTPLTMEALNNMPYMKACLRESFRLHFPVFGGSGRVLSKDITFSGYNIPQGTFIFANLAAMSRMEEYYPRPLEYHPERWLRDDRADMGAIWPSEAGFLSLPFSHGLRACPGKRFAEQSLYLAVATILQNFRLEYHGETMGMIHMPFTQPDKPLDINFIPRED